MSPVPAFLPICIALLATITRGCTGFGDGITFQVLWSAASVFLLPSYKPADAPQSEWDRLIFAKGVLYSTVAQSVSMPLQVWLARRELPKLWGYAIVMMACGAPGVVLGAHILLVGDVTVVKLVVGIFFLCFSVVQGTSAAIKYLNSKAAAAEAGGGSGVVAAPVAETVEVRTQQPVQPQQESLQVAGAAAPPVTEVSPGSAASDEALLPGSVAEAVVDVRPLSSGEADSPAQQQSEAQASHPAAVAESPPATRQPPPSDGEPVLSGPGDKFLCLPLAPLATAPWWRPPRRALALLSIASAATGFLSGVTGAGGPPLMAAYAVLVVPKDRLRGMACVAVGLMAVRLTMFTSSTGSVFDWTTEAWTYVGIGVSAWVGVAIGDKLRKYVDTITIVRMILGLVFTSSGLTLGALKRTSVGVSYLLLIVGWTSLFLYFRAHPRAFKRLKHSGHSSGEAVAAVSSAPAPLAAPPPVAVALQRPE